MLITERSESNRGGAEQDPLTFQKEYTFSQKLYRLNLIFWAQKKRNFRLYKIYKFQKNPCRETKNILKKPLKMTKNDYLTGKEAEFRKSHGNKSCGKLNFL